MVVKLQKYIHCGHWRWRGSGTRARVVSFKDFPRVHQSVLIVPSPGSCVSDRGVGPRASEQHVLVVYGPLAAAVGLQLVVRIPLRDDGSVGGTKQRPSPHRLAPPQRKGH